MLTTGLEIQNTHLKGQVSDARHMVEGTSRGMRLSHPPFPSSSLAPDALFRPQHMKSTGNIKSNAILNPDEHRNP